MSECDVSTIRHYVYELLTNRLFWADHMCSDLTMSHKAASVVKS
jgi:hypothetical protein